MKVDTYGFLRGIEAKLDEILSKEIQMAADIAGIRAEMAQLVTSVAGITDVATAAVTALNGVSAQNADLRAQLADALARGADPAVIQPILDQFDAQQAALDASKQALANAIVANTPAQP